MDTKGFITLFFLVILMQFAAGVVRKISYGSYTNPINILTNFLPLCTLFKANVDKGAKGDEA